MQLEADSDLLKILPAPLAGRTGWPWTVSCDPAQFNSDRKWPKVSIVIPSYNHGMYIEETIRSVLLQNYPNLELLLIDGGSTDATPAIIDAYKPFIDYCVSENDNGQSHALNKGFRRQTGELIAWINSDDLYTKDAFYHLISQFLKDDGTTLIYGNAITEIPGVRSSIYKAAPFNELDFVSRVAIHQPGTMWRTNVFPKTGLLDESLHMCMDYDLWMRIVFDYKVEVIPHTLAVFRRYREAKSSNVDDQTALFMDYRKVVCRFFTTVAPHFMPELRKMNLFENEEMVTYPIERTFKQETLRKMLHAYIRTCTHQEYNMGHIGKVNRLLKYNLNRFNFSNAMIYLVKNNLRVRKFKHPYKSLD